MPTLRLIEHTRTLYYNKSTMDDALPLGTIDELALPYENYQLAYTEQRALNNPQQPNQVSDLLDDIFDGKATGADMLLGQFENIDDDWWIRSGVIDYIDTSLPTPETAADAADRFYTPIAYTDQYGSTTTVSYDQNYYLFVEETEDALQNTNTVTAFDYRTLSPVEMKDQNDNLSAVILDELGLPKAMALMGKGSQADDLGNLMPQTLSTEQNDIADFFDEADNNITDSDNLHDIGNTLLREATARFVYDLHSYANNGTPCVVSSILREEHYAINNASPLQISFEYSNGLGKVAMKKMQAEAGEAKQVTDNNDGTISINDVNTADGSSDLGIPSLRWIGTGRTVLNNKGNVVKQYEPFFSVTAKYESQTELTENGVTPILYYDAQNRLIKTEFPDGTFSKTEYSAWKQTDYDQNDTCDNTSAWYLAMYDVGINTPERNAATKSYAHFDTPKISHFDTLGRVTTEEENDGTNTLYTHLILDIEGNLRQVIDARNNTVMQYKYDMLGHMVYQNSMDSGQRWLLNDCMGAPLRTWDERDFETEFAYDALHRPLTVTVLDGDGANPLNNIVEKYIYGEGQTNDKTNNLRGNLYQHYDTAGLEETPQYDFKNKALSSTRTLASDYKNVVDWNVTTGKLEATSYTIVTQYDALERIKLQTAPDASVITPTYNARGVLVGETVNQGAGNVTHLANIEYDAKGQRTYVEYGNGTFTEYTYDEKTFRLKRLLTKKGSSVLQDQYFYYDAVGNMTWKQDDNIPDVFYNNSVVQAANQYTYDALYRLTEATGREHIAGATFGASDNWDDNPFKISLSIGNNVAMQNYTQNFEYDEVGNILELQHVATNGSYTRTYDYSNTNNRLLSTTVGSNTYNYNYHAAHGYIIDMPHLSLMQWNWKEELAATSKQNVSAPNIPETTYYQYDSKGKRLRKITENFSTGATPTLKNQRIYIEGYEFYEDLGTSDTTETLSLIDEGRRFVMIENSSVSGLITRYIHPNNQNSCTLETDDNGDIITYEEYHPYGTTSYQASNAAINAAYKRYRYCGLERDDETGLNYHNARYYINWLGRWLNCDPIGINDGINVYSYCRNNPTTNTDVRGTQTKPLPQGVTMKNGFPFINLTSTASNNATSAASLQSVNSSSGATPTGQTANTNSTGQGGFAQGFAEGFSAGFDSSVDFAKSLTTTQGWKNVGEGLVNTAKLFSLTPEGTMARANLAANAVNYLKDLPNKSAYELGKDVGFATEKIGESVVLSKGAGIVAQEVKGASLLSKTKVLDGKGVDIKLGETAPVANAVQGIAKSKAMGNAMERALGMSPNKTAITIGGRTRFPDRLDLLKGTLEESKNVGHLNFTGQLRDYLKYSQDNSLDFILHTRPSTTFSKPLQDFIDKNIIIHNPVNGF